MLETHVLQLFKARSIFLYIYASDIDGKTVKILFIIASALQQETNCRGVG